MPPGVWAKLPTYEWIIVPLAAPPVVGIMEGGGWRWRREEEAVGWDEKVVVGAVKYGRCGGRCGGWWWREDARARVRVHARVRSGGGRRWWM